MNYFAHLLPVPYPDELWYSTVARYHRKSGNPKRIDTYRCLFDEEKDDSRIPVLLSNPVMIGYYKRRGKEAQLPDIIQSHTLVPFAFRTCPAEDQQKLLEGTISNMVSTTVVWNALGLHYCPQCFEEDMKNYGESFWHRNHQLPHISACTKHGCRLYQAQIKVRSAEYHWMCADEDSCPRKEVIPAGKEELLLAEYLELLLYAPIGTKTRAFSPSAICRRLQDEGILSAKSMTNGTDAEALRRGLEIQFGKGTFRSYFPKRFNKISLSNLVTGTGTQDTRDAAQYAMLCAYLELPHEQLFPVSPIMLQQEEREVVFRKLSERGLLFSRDYVAKETGLAPEAVPKFAKKLGIEPFWETKKRESQKAKSIHVAVPEEIYQQITARAVELGAGSLSAYMRYCAEREMENNL